MSLYLFLYDSSKQIENVSVNYVTSNSINTINYLKEMLKNKFEIITSNLDILSNLPSIKSQNISAISNLGIAQYATNNLTGSYGWIDGNGKLLWSTAFSSNKTTYQMFSNFNASERPYFKTVKETFKPFITEGIITQNYSQYPRLVISYPILSIKPGVSLEANYANNDQFVNANVDKSGIEITANKSSKYLKDNFDFKGVIFATIDNAKLNNFMHQVIPQIDENDLDDNDEIIPNSSSYSSSNNIVLLIDKKDLILFSNDQKILVGSAFNSTSTSQQNKDESADNKSEILTTNINNIYNAENKSSTFNQINRPSTIVTGLEVEVKPEKDLFDISRFILNIQPLIINDSPVFDVVTATPFTLSESANDLINLQIYYTFFLIGGLLFVIFGFIVIVLLINKKLKHEVEEKTTQLKRKVRELRASNDKLKQSELMEKEFINIAAHELRTPTQAIIGYSELNDEILHDLDGNIQKNVLTNEEIETGIKLFHEYHQSISRNASRLNALINSLLDIAKFDSNNNNNIHLKIEKIDLVKEIIDLTSIQFNQKIKDKNIKIDFSYDDIYECWVFVDRLRLAQVINNLIDNAIKFSNPGGIINISMKVVNVKYNKQKDQGQTKGGNRDSEIPKYTKEIHVIITDQGKGVSSQILPKLFEKYIKDSSSGTGLGLYIAKKIIEVHGGRIWAFNNQNGMGSTFVFSLPLPEDRLDQ
ncbi:MAG: HAMP domain-containing histidine kinase [Thermoproteota archaeon]|nr:HAMP domain-containing histidine kinase [Thermoproteota archaeon]